MSFAAGYARFRGSTAFPLLLVGAVVGWMAWSILAADGIVWGRRITDIPGEWGSLNIALSFEASVSTSLLLMDLARSERLQKRQLARLEELAVTNSRQLVVLQHMVESQLTLIEQLTGGVHVAALGAARADAGAGVGARDE